MYGAGFWIFFNDVDGSCQKSGVCPANTINIRNGTSIAWFGIKVKDNVNVIDNNGVTLVTENNNPGGLGGFGVEGCSSWRFSYELNRNRKGFSPASIPTI